MRSCRLWPNEHASHLERSGLKRKKHDWPDTRGTYPLFMERRVLVLSGQRLRRLTTRSVTKKNDEAANWAAAPAMAFWLQSTRTADQVAEFGSLHRQTSRYCRKTAALSRRLLG